MAERTIPERENRSAIECADQEGRFPQ